MIHSILAKKVGMTQVFEENGAAIPVTVLEAGPCVVMQVKTASHDGYDAVQLGFLDRKEKHATKAEIGHAKKSDTAPKRFVREVGLSKDAQAPEVGAQITPEIFEDISFVDVTGTSKGRGFAGVMKRHGFSGGPKTHGQSDRARAPGAIGQCSDPSRVFKGVRMPGHMGVDRVSVQNLKLVRIDKERNLMMVHGAVPGPNGGYLIVKASAKSFKTAAKA